MSAKPSILLLVVARGSPTDANSDNTEANKKLVEELSNDGYDVTLLALNDDEASDLKVKQTLADKTFELVLVGGGVRKVPAWHERVRGLLENTSSGKAIMVEPTHPGEAADRVRQALPAAKSLAEASQ